MDANLIETWFEIAALGLAAIFFILRAFGAYLRVNLSLALEGERKCATEVDDLAITVKVTKLKNGGIHIYSAKVRVAEAWPNGSKLREGDLKGITRIERIDTWQEGNRPLTFPPDDSTQLGFYCTVPKGTACLVEVLIIGRGLWRPKKGQWRASKVILANAS